MTVKELIAFLMDQPQDLEVAHQQYSEAMLLDTSKIAIETACRPRADGWIHDKRPDKPMQQYLMFPGN